MVGKGGNDRAHMSGGFVSEVEEALVETAKEADRQKKFLEQQTRNLKHRLFNVKKETYNMSRFANLLFSGVKPFMCLYFVYL